MSSESAQVRGRRQDLNKSAKGLSTADKVDRADCSAVLSRLTISDDETAAHDQALNKALIAKAHYSTPEGLVSSREAMELAERLKSTDRWCQAASLHAVFLWVSGRLQAADDLFERISHRATAASSAKGLFSAELTRGYTRLMALDSEGASRHFSIARENKSAGEASISSWWLLMMEGIARCQLGDLRGAKALLPKGPCRPLEAHIAFLEGNFAYAEALVKKELDKARRTGNRELEWLCVTHLARLYRNREQFDLAEQLILSSPVLREGIIRVPETIRARADLGLVYAWVGNGAAARKEMRACEQLMAGYSGWCGLVGYVERVEGVILELESRSADGAHAFGKALTTFKRFPLPLERVETLLIWGELFLRKGNLGRAMQLVAEAEGVCRSIGAAGDWITRAQALSAKRPPNALMTEIGPGMSDSPSSQHATGSYSKMYALAQEATANSGTRPQDQVYEYATVKDVALIATFIHDALAHLMSAINKASGLQASLDRIGEAIEFVVNERFRPRRRTRRHKPADRH